MRTWRSKSWSQTARRFSDKLYLEIMSRIGEPLKFYDFDWNFHEDVSIDQYASHIFNTLGRNSRIKYRAAKRFGRIVRGQSKVNINN